MSSLDGTNIRKDLGESKINFKHLVATGANFRNGDLRYSISNKSTLDVIHNSNMNTLRVEGCFPYFIHGHNFNTTNQDWINSLLLVSDMLNVDLTDSEVLYFEYGQILATDIPIKEILANHIGVQGMKTRLLDNGKYFVDPNLTIKLYNAKANILSKIPLQIRNKIKQDFGYDESKNYLKIEGQYKRPEVYFKERGIKVSTLLGEDFEVNVKNDLLTNYQRIKKTGVVEIPSKKRDLSVASINLLALKEAGKIYGFDENELLKNILKSIPNEVLNKDDKKYRRSKIKSLSEALISSQGSKYDLTELLVATLT